MSIQRRPAKGKPTGGGKPKWIVRYRDPSGRERSTTFTNRAEAVAYDEEQSRLLRRSEWIDEDNAPTLATVWVEWTNCATRPGTKRLRQAIGNNLGHLGPMRITKIKPSHLRTWQNQLASGRPWIDGCEGLAPNTLINWWGQLQGCLTMAVNDDMLHVNPCSKVAGPKIDRRLDPRSLPTVEQIGSFIQAADDEGYDTVGTMVLLAVSTGMRAGEVCGLRWQSIDREEGCIHVVEQMIDGKFSPLKTGASLRIVPIPREVTARLLRHRMRHPAAADGPLFTTSIGASFNSDKLAKHMRRIAPTPWTFHTLRHVFASAMIRQGRGVKAVQTILGHSSAAMTLDTYSHMWPDENDLVRSASGDLVRDICGMAGPKIGLDHASKT